MAMTPTEKAQINEHVQAIARIMYADKSQLTNLGQIETGIRAQLQEHVRPQVGVFLSPQLRAPMPDTSAP